MVAFYKHDIASWMDGTEGLDHEEYRAYHVICQLIYLNEGPVARHETGIAGRCNMHPLKFRAVLDRLIGMKKIVLFGDKLGNVRVGSELGHIEVRRRSRRGQAEVAPGSDGGQPSKSLENNNPPVGDDANRLEKTRQDETIKKKEDVANAPLDVRFYRRAKEILGDKRGGQYATRILKAFDRNYSEGMILLERAHGKEDPIPYIERVLRNLHNPQLSIHPGL